jgi:O-antigen/teichoic acid export membrane protein
MIRKAKATPATHHYRQARVGTPARGTVQLLAARGCLMISGYLISVILARGLGPVEYGVYGVILSVLMWIEMAASAGIPGATVKLIPQHEGQAPAVEQTARMLLLTVSLAFFLLCWWAAPLLARLFDIPSYTRLFRLAILDIPFSVMYFAYQGVLHGNRQFGTLSLSFIIYSLTKLAAILALFVLGLSVAGALIVNVLATVCVLVYLVIKVPHLRSRPSYALVHSILRTALPMGLYLMSLQVLLSVDLWSLKSLWTGEREVIGFYVAALNIAKMLTVVPSVVSGVLFASLAWALTTGDEVLAQRYIKGAGKFALVLLAPSCALLALHAEPVMLLLYSNVYSPGGIYLSLQLIAFALLAFLDIFSHALIVTGKTYQSASILLALIPIAILFNMTFIPKFGAMGAAASLIFTIGLGTCVAAVLAYRRFGCLIRFATVIRVVVAVVLTAILSTRIPTPDSWLLPRLFALLVVYLLLLGLFKELSLKELSAFTSWQRSIVR